MCEKFARRGIIIGGWLACWLAGAYRITRRGGGGKLLAVRALRFKAAAASSRTLHVGTVRRRRRE